MMSLVGYFLTSVVSPVVAYFVTKHTNPEIGLTVGAGVAGIGSRVLHLCDPPSGN